MTDPHDNFFVLTGGPGSGKTTLLAALAARGFPVMEEAGRGVIRQQVACGGSALPWADRALFAELMLSWEMRSHDLAQRQPAPSCSIAARPTSSAISGSAAWPSRHMR